MSEQQPHAFADVWYAAQFGVFVMTTSAGIMDHEEARRKKVGGKVRTPPLFSDLTASRQRFWSMKRVHAVCTTVL